MKKTTHSKKKFNPMDYKGYMLVLAVLFVVLFLLIRIAVGMINDTYPAKESTSLQETKKEFVLETESFKGTIKETVKETKKVPETEKVKETIKETEVIPEPIVDKNDSLLVLVNRDHPIAEDASYTLVPFETEYQVDERMFKPLTKMLTDAKKEGHELVICSAWRECALQEKLYANKVDEYLSYGYSWGESEELAAFWVAKPGTSEHEIGLAVDIVAKDYQHLDHSQADTEEQQWLMQHCHEYGFILRYPEDKQDVTHIGYEPWHYRYVGKAAAKAIMTSGLCLEEYIETK